MPIQTTRHEPAKLGLGYSELTVGEAKQYGDEFTAGAIDRWISIPDCEVGCHIKATSLRHRRKIEDVRKAA